MSTLGVFLEQVAKSATILLDDVVVLAKPALSRIGDTAGMAKMAAASAMDDTMPLAKTAMKKASAVVVDDTAVSSDQLNEASIAQHREYAVWRKIVVGSLLNKIVILAVILVAGSIAPVIPHIMLALGAAYLAFEGAHKVMEYAHHLQGLVRSLSGATAQTISSGVTTESAAKAVPAASWKLPVFINKFLGQDPKERAVLVDLILLDAILSTEILLVANGTLGAVGLAMQLVALGIVALGTTLGVYGIVLAIVRADNVAGYFAHPESRFYCPGFARGMMKTLPYAMKIIGVIGTAAMLGVAGDVVLHMVPSVAAALAYLLPPTLLGMVVGFVAGLLLLGAGSVAKRLRAA